MAVRTLKPDDPEFARYLAESTARATVPTNNLPPGSFSPRFGDYIEGRLDGPPAEVKMAEQKRATKDETVELPDGRLIQVQAKGGPVDEKLAEREREFAKRAAEEETDPLREIQPDAGTRALGTGTRETGAKALSPEPDAKKK